MDRPKTDDGFVAEDSDKAMIKLFGGGRFESVAFTHDQIRRFARFYGYDLKDEIPLIQAGNHRNMFREVALDGMRIMAFLAKHSFLEEDVDPVTSLAHAIDQDLFSTIPDIWNEPEED